MDTAVLCIYWNFPGIRNREPKLRENKVIVVDNGLLGCDLWVHMALQLRSPTLMSLVCEPQFLLNLFIGHTSFSFWKYGCSLYVVPASVFCKTLYLCVISVFYCFWLTSQYIARYFVLLCFLLKTVYCNNKCNSFVKWTVWQYFRSTQWIVKQRQDIYALKCITACTS
jgi:hypothetical protein